MVFMDLLGSDKRSRNGEIDDVKVFVKSWNCFCDIFADSTSIKIE